jgi:hypothetical protein
MAAGPINFVQGHYEASNVPLAKMTVVYTEAQKAGDLNVVIAGSKDRANITSVSDTMGNHYVVGVGPQVVTIGGAVFSQSIYYASNILPAPARGNTVTVRFNAPAATADIRTLEYSGVAPVDPFYIASAMGGNSAWSRSGNLIIFLTPVLLVAANLVATHTAGPTGSFIQRLTSDFGNDAEDRVVSALTGTHSFNAGATLTVPGPWLMEMVIFRGIGAPPP